MPIMTKAAYFLVFQIMAPRRMSLSRTYENRFVMYQATELFPWSQLDTYYSYSKCASQSNLILSHGGQRDGNDGC